MNATLTQCAGPGPVSKPFANLGFGWLASLALCLPLALATALLLLARPRAIPGMEAWARPAAFLVWCLLNGAFLAMLKTGRTDKFRSALFIATSVAFVLTFVPNLISLRGGMSFDSSHAADGRIPMCHIVIPMLLIPAALKQTIIFPGSLTEGFANVAGMLVLWFVVTLALGRGWCSWGCFYGGLDEGFSRLGRKARLRTIDRRWTHVPLALLLTVMLLSAASLSPTYCEWLCPFKAVTEFEKVTTIKIAIQTALFVSLFVGLVVVLPFLTKKRTQCALLCPMGAFQSWTNAFTLHRVAIDRDRCIDCGLCVRSCPTLSITRESVAAGRALSTCTKCGRCVDACPKGAISYRIKGTPLRSSPSLARVLYLYPAMIALTIFGGGMMAGALQRLAKLATTGSMI